jgi:hypothetical protein
LHLNTLKNKSVGVTGNPYFHPKKYLSGERYHAFKFIGAAAGGGSGDSDSVLLHSKKGMDAIA